MKEMTIKETVRINVLLERGAARTLREALAYDGDENTLAKRIADKTIQSLARDNMILDGKVDLYMGADNVPYRKQSSLRVLAKNVSNSDVMRACIRISSVERAYALGCQEYELPKKPLTVEEVRKYYKYIEPIFQLIEAVQINEDDVVLAFLTEEPIGPIESWDSL